MIGGDTVAALLFAVFFPALVVGSGGGHHHHEDDCPTECICDRDQKMMTCGGPSLHTIPSRIPTDIDSLTIKNASELYIVPKHAFRKLEKLKEIRFVNCDRLETIEKLAFKNMRRLRLISFSGCPSLTELVKGAFSNIQNEDLLTIQISSTPIRTVHGGAFRHAARLREVSISGSELHLQPHSFSSINQLDFLNLSGVAKIDQNAFTNSTRFHYVNIYGSTMEVEKKAFADLSHIHQILIQRCNIASIPSGTFSGLSTLEKLELFDNEIGLLSPHAFTGVVNIGQIILLNNRIKRMESPDALNQGEAIQLHVSGNEIRCSCDLKWMTHHLDKNIVDGNFCGVEGVHRTLRSYLRYECYNSHNHKSNPMTRTNQIQITKAQARSSPSLTITHYVITLLIILHII